MVDLLFKRALRMIIGSTTGIAKKHKIHAKDFTEAELIGAEDVIQ